MVLDLQDHPSQWAYPALASSLQPEQIMQVTWWFYGRGKVDIMYIIKYTKGQVPGYVGPQ